MNLFLRHGLKLLNLSVVFYIISGALVFHWLGEFQPGGADGQKPDRDGSPTRPPPAKSIGELRLSSVRRMWNITNQLNILYESNWTELVLAELVEFERLFVDSLEQLASGVPPEPSKQGDKDDDDEEYPLEDLQGDEKSDKDQDKKKRKNENGQSGATSKRPEAKKLPSASQQAHKLATGAAEERLRVESIKKSLVHSLATITTMGSPIRQPASQLGRLLTVLYGTLGIPLLIVTVAKSGQHLARSSLNGLLYIRHYCLTLPLHYLCCSCNLLVCLRLLSWCCCCCCCSYLFCLNDKKQTKCCDFGNAPTLKLHRKRRPTTRQDRRRLKRADVTEAEWGSGEGEPPRQSRDEAAPGGTYVIGFNLQQMSQNERQKSVRFSERREANSLRATTSSSSSSEDEDGNSSASDLDGDRDEAWRLLASSLAVLLAYVMLGALYHAHQHDLPLVDALFACFSMLSTSKLPDSFQLDGANPIALYKSRAKQLQTKSKISAESSSKLIASEDLALILDSLYLLVGLNMIAACAQFGRLWFNGTVRRKFSACPKAPASSSEKNQSSSSLTGSFERNQSNQFTSHQSNNFTPSSATPTVPQNDQQVGLQLNQFAVLNPANEATNSPACSTEQMHQEATELTAQQASNQLNLSELFVLNPTDQLACNQIHYQQHSDGASFASSSSQTAVAPSLCAHHQKAAAAQNTLERHHQHRLHFHHHHHNQHQTNGLSDCSSGANTNSQPNVGPLHHSSSLMQLFEAPQLGYAPNQNSGTTTLTRRNQPVPLYKNGFQQNGLNGGQQEPDSSPNTFDITNSQTISSSASSRAAPSVMKPSRFVVGQQLPATVSIRPANEKAVSWFEANNDNDRVKQY